MIRHFWQRPSVFISAAFVFTLCLCCYAENGTAEKVLPLAVVFSVIAMAITAAMHRFRITFKVFLIFMLCAAMPLGAYLVKCSDDKFNIASEYIGKTITAEGMVYHYQNEENGYTVYLCVGNVDGRKTEKFNLRIRVDGMSAPRLYDTAVFEVTPESFCRVYYRPYAVSDYYRSEGLHADASGVFIETKNGPGLMLRFVRFMEASMSRALDKLENFSLAKTLIIGDRAWLDDYTSDIFTKAGIAHVLALSGLHIGIILAFARKFMRALTLTKYITIPISVLVVLFYIVMTGGSYSVMRAGIMAITGFGAFLLLMRRDILNSVAIAVTLILMYEPYAVKSLSFQLSCGAVIGIAVFALPVMKYIRKRLEKYLCSKKRYIRFLSNTLFTMLTSVTVTFSVLFFTFPTTLYYAGDILPVSFFSNIVIIPLTAPVMMVLITYIILYFIPLFPVRMIAEKIFASAADIMLGFFEKTAEFFAGMDIPMINLSQMAYSVFAVSVAVAFSVLILTKARIRRYNAVFCIVSAVCIMLFVSDLFYKSAEIHFLSEDYSSCTIFKQDKKTVVCVGGNDFSYAVVSYCDKYLNNSVDAVIIPPQCGDCISSFDIIYAEGIDVESIYVYDEDENAAKIKALLGTVFPDTKIYKYKTGQPFLDGFAIRADGALEKEIFSKRFVLCNADNEPFGDLGDVSVAYYGKDGEVFEHGIKTHDITYCKTHIFNITDSKITMRCYG